MHRDVFVDTDSLLQSPRPLHLFVLHSLSELVNGIVAAYNKHAAVTHLSTPVRYGVVRLVGVAGTARLLHKIPAGPIVVTCCLSPHRVGEGEVREKKQLPNCVVVIANVPPKLRFAITYESHLPGEQRVRVLSVPGVIYCLHITLSRTPRSLCPPSSFLARYLFPLPFLFLSFWRRLLRLSPSPWLSYHSLARTPERNRCETTGAYSAAGEPAAFARGAASPPGGG